MKLQAVKETTMTLLKKVKEFDPYVHPPPQPGSEWYRNPDPYDEHPKPIRQFEQKPTVPMPTGPPRVSLQAPSTTSKSDSEPPRPKGILRRPSAHFVTYDEEGNPSTEVCGTTATYGGGAGQDWNGSASTSGTTTDKPRRKDSYKAKSRSKAMAKCPSSDDESQSAENPMNPVRLRHTERKLSYVPPDWKPGMEEPVIHGRVTYVSVNNPPKPDRYYRGNSTVPFPHPGYKCIYRTLHITLKKDHKRLIDHIDPKDLEAGEYWDQEEQDGLTDHRRRKESKFLIQQAERDRRMKWRNYRMCFIISFCLVNYLHWFLGVFGGHVKIQYEKASTLVSVHGYQMRVPIVVKACVEEIYRRGELRLFCFSVAFEFTYTRIGMDEPRLIVQPPKAKRVIQLVNAYDFLTDQIPLPDLSQENIHVVMHVLGFWMQTLPQPFMHRTYTDALSAWCVEPCRIREKEFKYKIHTRRFKGEDGEYHSETDTEAEAESEEDEACAGLPSFNSRRKRMRRKQRAIERAKRRSFARQHPDLVISNRPSHQQRRMQMYRELHHLETPQVNHARLVLLLMAPHCFSTLVYLLTFLASLLDHPENGLTPKIIADWYAWKLFGGPNKDVSKEVMEWLLTRWNRIVEGYKSHEARAWEKKREQERKLEEIRAKDGSSSKPAPQTQTDDSESAPQYQDERKWSGESDRSAAPSYHSQAPSPRLSYSSPSQTEPTSTSTSPPDSSRPRRRSAQRRPPGTRGSAAASKSGDTPAPRRTVRILSPTPSDYVEVDKLAPVAEFTNPWDAEDTPVISPFKDEDNAYQAEDEDFGENDDDTGGWDEPQRAEFAAIEDMLHQSPQSITSTQQRAPSVHSEAASIYSDGEFPTRSFQISH